MDFLADEVCEQLPDLITGNNSLADFGQRAILAKGQSDNACFEMAAGRISRVEEIQVERGQVIRNLIESLGYFDLHPAMVRVKYGEAVARQDLGGIRNLECCKSAGPLIGSTKMTYMVT